MREIKFRAWDTIDNQFINIDNMPIKELQNLFRTKVMQFTGLQDKNGVDIYEGDLLEFDGGNQLAVFFEAGSFGCADHYLNFLSFCDWNMLIAEVVGNIHENKI